MHTSLKDRPLARSELRIAVENDTDELHPVPSKSLRGRRRTLLLRIASWLYLLLLVLMWLGLWAAADRHWLGTLIEFGPRWGLLIPLPLIALVALVYDRHLFWPAGLALVIGMGPLTGFCLPLPLRLSAGLSPPLRVMTLNTDGQAQPADVVALAESAQVDVVCLQEVYRPESWVPHFGPEWDVHYQDEFVIASRHRISEFEALAASDGAWDRYAMRCQLNTPLGTVHLVNLHTHSLRKGLEAIRYREPDGIAVLEHYTQRRNDESRQIVEWVRDVDGPILLAGDFNMAAGTLAFDQHWGNYLNAYSESGSGWGATFFSRWHGVRIDHVLASRDFQALDCWVAHDIGSAHRPVIATLQLVR